MERMLKILNDLKGKGIIKDYALGGATALLFYYSEVTSTYDVDVFAYLPKTTSGFIDLPRVYQALQEKGYALKEEHVMIEGIPVQFLSADSNALVEEGVKEAVVKNFQKVQTRVIGFEHLLAIMLQTGRPKDKERIGVLLEAGLKFDKNKFFKILTKHKLKEKWERIIGKTKQED